MSNKARFELALCEALIDGWHADQFMGQAISRAWHLTTDDVPADPLERHMRAVQALKVARIDSKDRIQTWIPVHFRAVNEMLWAYRKRDACIDSMARSLGFAKKRIGTMAPELRNRDKRLAWNVVK